MTTSWLRRLLRPLSGGPESPPPPRDRAESAAVEYDPVAAGLESAIAEHRARRWAAAEPLLRWVIENPAAAAGDRHVARNILGNLLERNRRAKEAVEVYEANLAERFSGSYPYERLAAIYRKQRRPNDELRVLRQAVAVVEQEQARGRAEVAPQLERLRAELAEAIRRNR